MTASGDERLSLDCSYCGKANQIHWPATRRSGGFTCEHCYEINLFGCSRPKDLYQRFIQHIIAEDSMDRNYLRRR